MREEQEIFGDLAALCGSPGYVHAIASLCFRDNMIAYRGEMTAEDMQHMFSMSRLVRTEISALIGLLIKQEIDYAYPGDEELSRYVQQTEKLLKEVHEAMLRPWKAAFDPQKAAEHGARLFTSGDALREPIFYGGESAYSFQYRDFSPLKYAADDDWLRANKGFTISLARDVVEAVGRLLNEKLTRTLGGQRRAMLPSGLLQEFILSAAEVASFGRLDEGDVLRVLQAFSMPGGPQNTQFKALHDFNATNAYPLLRTPDGRFVLFQIYGLVEALYETPYYWMGADKAYVSVAMAHRGAFTERFVHDRLALVFGQKCVFSNVDLFELKGQTLGEIDVLVIFGNRAIVLQAKSKRLTLEARKGHDGRVKDDFQKSVQDAYDQGFACSKLLLDPKIKIACSDGREVPMPQELKEVYIFCVVSDHYPALSFQTRQFLKVEQTSQIQSPFVMDIFALDAMTEMLPSPLHFLSYVNRRVNYADRLMVTHELTTLAYHLKQNLWIDDDCDILHLSDDIGVDLDLAMMARRDGVEAKRTPEGILTRLKATAVGRIIEEVEAQPRPQTIDLGFMLLTLSGDTAIDTSKGIDRIVQEARRDGKTHDITVGVGKGDTGFTVHCNSDADAVAVSRLHRHCEGRKYTEKAATWFGVCLNPRDASVRFGVNLDYPWQADKSLEKSTQWLKSGTAGTSVVQLLAARRKTGRNDPCPCGSGRKYKKCCLS